MSKRGARGELISFAHWVEQMQASSVTALAPRASVLWARCPPLLLGCLLALLLAACGPDLQPLILAATPWRAGEISIYQITDVNGGNVGTAQYEIRAGGSDNPAGWIVRRVVEAQGDTEVATVVINGALRPLSSELNRSGAQGKQLVKALYNQGQVDLELTSQSVTTVERINVPSDSYDEYMLWQVGRALPLAVGYATQLNTFHTVTGLQNRVTVAVVGVETVNVPAGNFTTWQVTFRSNTSETTVWYTQDAPHTLVKFIEGRNQGTFILVEYKPGQ